MGMILYTQSGTFVPSDHGLNVGDTIYVRVVGGGGSGASTTCSTSATAGNAGSASSFGSILTAAGGAGGAASYWLAPIPQYTNAAGQACFIAVGQSGQDGWLPGMPSSGTRANSLAALFWTMGAVIQSNSATTAIEALSGFQVAYSYGSTECSTGITTSQLGGGNGAVYAYGYYSSNNHYTAACGGRGGHGYGAGGGGNAYLNARYRASANYIHGAGGGSAGVIADTDYVLTSTSSVAVTVGAGGAATTNGGAGMSGCVAVFW